ncbi:MAG TPA: hypothetical protein PKO18_02460 [Chitinophagales bacterium]|nr:hypothetical protein [Chitinophagales bacterium]HNL84070.1 hypothetical protein [Chitinophagales bacterium]
MFSWLTKKIKSYIIKKASQHRAVDIVEVRTKEIGLLSVKTETVLKLLNSFFLPITLLKITTDLVNRDGIKIGKMNYTKAVKLRARSETIITTNSEISSITSLFQALTNLLAQPIYMRSIGKATLKFLWWTVDIDVDDVFEIHPSKLKIRKEETEEDRIVRLQREEERKAKLAIVREEQKLKSAIRKEKRKEHYAARKEKILSRRHKENYIPKEERRRLKEVSEESDAIIIEPIVWDENTVMEQMTFTKEEVVQLNNEDVAVNNEQLSINQDNEQKEESDKPSEE